MSGYTKERDEFIAIMTAEGMSVESARKLLRYGQTLNRLAVAQCNGDWPYNGDRDRPEAKWLPCVYCDGHGKLEMGVDECPQCKGSGKTWFRDEKADARHDARYAVCPACEASGVAKSAMKRSHSLEVDGKPVAVCPDCRTQGLVIKLLMEHCGIPHKITCEGWTAQLKAAGWAAIFGGDPRGCVFKVQVPSGRTNDWGKEGVCVPGRVRY